MPPQSPRPSAAGRPREPSSRETRSVWSASDAAYATACSPARHAILHSGCMNACKSFLRRRTPKRRGCMRTGRTKNNERKRPRGRTRGFGHEAEEDAVERLRPPRYFSPRLYNISGRLSDGQPTYRCILIERRARARARHRRARSVPSSSEIGGTRFRLMTPVSTVCTETLDGRAPRRCVTNVRQPGGDGGLWNGRGDNHPH